MYNIKYNLNIYLSYNYTRDRVSYNNIDPLTNIICYIGILWWNKLI